MSLPGASGEFDLGQLNAMQLTSVNALNAPSNGVLQMRTSAGQVFLENTEIAPMPNTHPFQIITMMDGDHYKYLVIPGTINNIVPVMKVDGSNVPLDNIPPPTTALGSSMVDELEYVFLELKSEDNTFPSGEPEVKHDTTIPPATDTTGIVVLGSVNKKNGQVDQFVLSSLCGERFKCGTNDAEYFYAAI
jgi:hypothetical protein